MQRLVLLPGERESCVGRQNRLEKDADVLQEKIQENEKKKAELLERKEKYCRVFELEYRLGYVEQTFQETEDMGTLAKAVCSRFAGSFGNKKQSDVFGSLQEAITRTGDIFWIIRLPCPLFSETG